MGSHLEPDKYERKLTRCKCLQDLNKLHNEYMARDREFIESLNMGEVFPAAPIRGNEDIEFIRFKKELLKEAQEMNHCIASYYAQIMRGQYFVFRIFKSQRATIGLIYSNSRLEINQIRLQNNRTPSKKTSQIVTNWLYFRTS